VFFFFFLRIGKATTSFYFWNYKVAG